MMTKHYTELTGAKGDRIQFGPPMYGADEFFLNAGPMVRIGQELYGLKSIGTLGFTLEGPMPKAVEAMGETLTAEFVQTGRQILTTEILKPVRIGDNLIECNCYDTAIDLEALSNSNAAAVAAARARKPSIKPVDVPSEYKVFCADLIDMLATVRHQIEREIDPFEKSLSPEERLAFDAEMEEAVQEEWRNCRVLGNELVLPFKYDDKMRAKMKRYTENVVTRELVRSPLLHRCYYKPMGYPGDYQIMNAFYEHRAKGDDAYTRLLDVLGLIAGKPVAARMRKLTEEIEKLIANRADQEHFHVMSIGSGPAEELNRYFSRCGGKTPKGFSITLVDPEAEALEYAISNIYGAIRHGVSSVMVSGMHTSFTEMLRPKSTFRHLPPQDFIYSAGLTDYLNTKLTRALVRKLYDHVKPGGTVLIGNINDAPDGMYWSAEHALDWTMYFRSKEEMEEIAEGMPGEVNLSLDESGSYYLLTLTKPA